jgi:hypothetical protein
MDAPMKRMLALGALAWILSTQQAFAEVRELPSPAAPGSLAPSLFAAADGRVFLSWIDRLGQGRHALRFAVKVGDGWSTPMNIAEGTGWFVNWADFPSLIALPDGSLAAHWLVKSGSGTYAYDVNIARSTDEGKTWSESLVPHRDGTQTEHGFVSLFAAPDNLLEAVWLDGRETRPGAGEHDHDIGAMTLRYASIGPDGKLSREAMLDARVCDCCQTSAARTAEGPVVVYRDRSDREIRDVSIVRLHDGRWIEPRPVSSDNWEMHGCPVNGPAVAAAGDRVAVAWFTAANDVPRVKLAFSTDAGASFMKPVIIDDGNPLGRLEVLLLDDGSALVSWLETTPEGSSLRVRRVGAGGQRDAAVTVLPAGTAISNGFPQMVRAGEQLVFAWTAERVRTAVMPVP